MFTGETHDADLLGKLRRARELSGKSEVRQLWEMMRLVLGPGHMSPWDYHSYRLWDDAGLSWAEKTEFIGNNIVDWTTYHVSDWERGNEMRDKVEMARIFEANGIRTPRTLAVYHPEREVPDTPVLRSAEELARFIREKIEYPFFFKPVTAHVSIGAGQASAYDRASDRLEMLEGDPMPVDEFVGAVCAYCSEQDRNLESPSAGYIFQEVARQHATVSEYCGPTPATFRVAVIVDDEGPHIYATPWKIPAPGVAADNFYRSGNLLADVDRETGTVRRVIRGTGFALEVFEENPYTGKRMAGWRVPMFEEVRETVLRGATLFQGAGLQGWDVGIGPEGPVVIEANHGASFRLPQYATGRGLATPQFREWVRRATAANPNRKRAWPISWSRRESIWRLEGFWQLAKSALGRG